MLVDLSHTFEDGMPGFVMHAPDGSSAPFTAMVRPFLTHDQSEPFYGGKASFELTEVRFHTSIGTYIDSPRHRFRGMRDISQLRLEELVLDGVVVHVPDAQTEDAIGLDQMDLPENVVGKAVLFRFDWDQYWGNSAYDRYPYIGLDVIERLIAGRVKLVGVDAINVDDRKNPYRPAHTKFLSNDILIVENLANLSSLPTSGFRFYAVPIKAKDATSMTVRAFAEM
ncbi:MAG TPA: cyclase family protein [Xanthobacteraceae bacterium]|nr:cyclase family protein [Xanthobacteraceae bacterium]